jgi:hypothetical protein
LSKISDRLTKLGQTERSGLGFGTRAANTKIPVILVGANIASAADSDGVDADLFILAANSNGTAQDSPVKDSELWGVSVAGGSGKDIDAAVEAGADFVVVEGESAPGAVLRDDDTGKGFIVGNAVSEDRSKAIDAGPFDFLILDGSKLSFPLSVGSMLDIQEQLARYSRHIFLNMTEIPDKENLELLRDIGISALIYDAKTADGKDLKGLRASIDELEPKKQKSTAGAMLPRTGESNQQDVDIDDHDHEHDDDDWE